MLTVTVTQSARKLAIQSVILSEKKWVTQSAKLKALHWVKAKEI
jgi:hypothetical protein